MGAGQEVILLPKQNYQSQKISSEIITMKLEAVVVGVMWVLMINCKSTLPGLSSFSQNINSKSCVTYNVCGIQNKTPYSFWGGINPPLGTPNEFY